MTYRRRGQRIQKKDRGQWVTIYTHPNADDARRHLGALMQQVMKFQRREGDAPEADDTESEE